MNEPDYLWDPAAPADPEIVRLEQALRPLRLRAGEAPALPAPVRPARGRRWAGMLAAAAALALVAVPLLRPRPDPWSVTRLAGQVRGEPTLRPGAAVETGGAGSAARIRVGRIGTAELGPGSRARLVRAAGREHRMALERGTLRASIWAPPRYFLVETPAGLAIDLGCVYTLRMDDDGRGMIRVASGQVEVVHAGRRTLVLAGNQASMSSRAGPGVPFPSTAGPRFRAALHAWEQAPTPTALGRLLDASGAGTTITLWYLLQRVEPAERPLVYRRLREVSPAAPAVSQASALRLEPEAIEAWRDALQDGWTTDSVPAYQRAWRRFRTATGG